jgi:hypothetical protein
LKGSKPSYQAQLDVGNAATAFKSAYGAKFDVFFAANVIPLELFGARIT